MVRLRIKVRDARGLTRPLRVAMTVEARRGLLIRVEAGLLLPHLDRPARVTVFVPWEVAATAGEFRTVSTRALGEPGVTPACAPVVGEVTGPVRGALRTRSGTRESHSSRSEAGGGVASRCLSLLCFTGAGRYLVPGLRVGMMKPVTSDDPVIRELVSAYELAAAAGEHLIVVPSGSVPRSGLDALTGHRVRVVEIPASRVVAEVVAALRGHLPGQPRMVSLRSSLPADEPLTLARTHEDLDRPRSGPVIRERGGSESWRRRR